MHGGCIRPYGSKQHTSPDELTHSRSRPGSHQVAPALEASVTTINQSVSIPKAREASELKVLAVRATELSKVYGTESSEVIALDGVSVDFARSQFTAIMGPSGSGKS